MCLQLFTVELHCFVMFCSVLLCFATFLLCFCYVLLCLCNVFLCFPMFSQLAGTTGREIACRSGRGFPQSEHRWRSVRGWSVHLRLLATAKHSKTPRLLTPRLLTPWLLKFERRGECPSKGNTRKYNEKINMYSIEVMFYVFGTGASKFVNFVLNIGFLIRNYIVSQLEIT